MISAAQAGQTVLVVPRKGDVDRNIMDADDQIKKAGSSPARGTWIEMQALADGDDPASGRPPQGGRG